MAFASVNTMSLFGLHRRWRGAALGHLAAVEMTSSEPSRRYSAGLRRLGFDERTTVFYDEHVEADAVHEQIASVDMCGSLVAAEPALARDVLFGAACSLAVDGLTAGPPAGRVGEGRSALTAGGTAAGRLTGTADRRRLVDRNRSVRLKIWWATEVLQDGPGRPPGGTTDQRTLHAASRQAPRSPCLRSTADAPGRRGAGARDQPARRWRLGRAGLRGR